MKLYDINNAADLFETLDECEHELTLETADGKTYLWQEQRNAFRALAVSASLMSLPALSIRCSDSGDVDRIMKYCMECRRTEIRKTA